MEELIDQFHLPKYVKGKSFADASSMIMDKFRERKDPESKRTMAEMLDRLRQAQEFIKEQNKTPDERYQEQIQLQEQQIQQEQPQDVNPEMEDQPQQSQFENGGNMTNTYEEGGLMDYMKKNSGKITSVGKGAMDMISNLSGEGVSTNATTAGLSGVMSGAQSGMALGPLGAIGGGILGGITGIIGSGKAKDKLAQKEMIKTQEHRGNTLNNYSYGGIMDSIDPNDHRIPEYAQGDKRFKGVPYKSDRYKRLLSTIMREDNRALKIPSDRSYLYKSANNFKQIKPSNTASPNAIHTRKNIIERSIKSGNLDNNVTSEEAKLDLIKGIKLTNNQKGNEFSLGGKMNVNQFALGDWLKTAGKNIGNAASKTGKFLNENKGDILRYAPTAINAAQLATLPKAEVESLNRLDNRYKPGYVDEATLQNTARENYNMTSQALTGASGGSTSALRSNILGAGLNRNKAISDAYLKSSDINRGEDAKAQQFNLGVDRVNLQQSNSEKDINARNRAARSNIKSKLLSGLGTDIGNIGKEERNKNIIEKITGYNQKGKLTNPKKINYKDNDITNNNYESQNKIDNLKLNPDLIKENLDKALDKANKYKFNKLNTRKKISPKKKPRVTKSNKVTKYNRKPKYAHSELLNPFGNLKRK